MTGQLIPIYGLMMNLDYNCLVLMYILMLLLSMSNSTYLLGGHFETNQIRISQARMHKVLSSKSIPIESLNPNPKLPHCKYTSLKNKA